MNKRIKEFLNINANEIKKNDEEYSDSTYNDHYDDHYNDHYNDHE